MNSNTNAGHIQDRSDINDELSSWLCDDRSYRARRRSAVHAPTSPTQRAQPLPPLSNQPPPQAPAVQAIRYLWDRSLSQGLELGRQTTSGKKVPIMVYWRPGSDVLGITLDVEATTRQIIVVQSTRRDLRAGSILLRVASDCAREDNFHDLLLAAKAKRGVTICLEFASPPAPVVVNKPNYELAALGVTKDASFELVAVDGCQIRYLSLQDIHHRIHNQSVSQTCEMIFERVEASQRGQRKSRSASGDADNNGSLATRGAQTAGIVTALAAVAVFASALS